ncbi:hypothetical protein C0992_003832 [Termitomyces sp. T32_za158]|nr:hypothetical protein C0992_003832 [Termitomyces sp. T32_za158]
MSEKLLAYIGTVNPLQLWIIQFSKYLFIDVRRPLLGADASTSKGIIISTAALLSFILRDIRQPKVIGEVLGGIVLGPTVCGRIPGFTEHVFPPESRPYLKLIADIGLCLFFFLVGLQIEPFVIKKNLRVSAIIALSGMIFPFITGAGFSVLLYQQFVNGNVQPTYFMFFTGVAFSVTAFPVMCRILTELKLLDTTVGATVISAGVGNDISEFFIPTTDDESKE